MHSLAALAQHGLQDSSSDEAMARIRAGAVRQLMRLSVSVQGDFVQEMFDVATQFLENEHELVLWVYSHTANTLPAQNLRCRQLRNVAKMLEACIVTKMDENRVLSEHHDMQQSLKTELDLASMQLDEELNTWEEVDVIWTQRNTSIRRGWLN
jgi:AcrR family transcriptional regulator